ncbi:Solute carrier family 35 member F4 [Trichoplax sp. H2]|nr:Solute carrier family 35 member F4 [Trichoplax sp. H2]|eukprot:RDD37189.1 Solute carrier family 35 member F4 [Trichoplax sp. H2]
MNITVALNYYPLNFTAPTDITAIFSSVLSMVYILSVLFLKEPFVLLRALAVCLSTTGVVLFAYDDGFGSFATLGVILSVFFTLCAACFRVYEKYSIGDASPIQASMLLTIISIINFLLGWIPVVIFHYTGFEKLTWSDIPWEPLMITNLFNMLHTYFIVVGVAVTYPVFISLGSLFGIPINAVIDAIFRNESFSALKIDWTEHCWQSSPPVFVGKESIKICPRKDIKKVFWLRLLPLAINMNMVIVLNYYPLNFTAPTDVTAVFSSVLGMVYVLSIIFLKEPFILLRAFAVCLSTAGVILFAYDDGFGSFAAIGVILSTLFALAAACFRVHTKVFIGDASAIQGSMLLSIISVLNLLLGWISVIIFHFAGIENLMWSEVPWEPLMITNLFNMLYTGSVIIGVAVTYPVFISLGALFGIPINAVIDVIFRNESFSVLKIFSTLLLALGFLILLIPLEKAQWISKMPINLLMCRRRKT